MTANELAQLLFKRWNGDDVEIPPNLDDLCSEMLQKQQAEIEVYKKALEKLARLGNGDNYGNSIGNDIAIEALRKAQEK